ncbi:hypothetical protein O3G_MSEX013922 [Manduca sexta]|uniref:Uncharacterized protein n=1 Tax=Manduca sexta TaxID=7130 RepID=A0A921ZV47_MANSE|nr:hypothetical protein O3G_MSEX013922 [Manduca sexta]
MKWFSLFVLWLCLISALAMPHGYNDTVTVSTETILSIKKRHVLLGFKCPKGYVKLLKVCIKIHDEDYDYYE